MPYSVPTATDLKARFPIFATVADATVTACIADASRFVDTSWLEADYQPAIMFLAAHYLVTEGATGANPAAAGPITGERLGDASVNYAAPSASAQVSDYANTVYGKRFLALLRVNQPGVLVV